ncbi:MAG: MFS transporter [Sulfobacillus sp.]|nr:MFS transporter [Sulfobacillus sp.]
MTGSNPNPRIEWIVALASLALVLDDWAQNLLLPLIPMWRHEWGWQGWQIGTALGAESAVVVWASPLVGYYLREPRPARTLAILALGMFGIALVVYGHAQAYGWWIAARLTQGAAVAVSFPAIFVWANHLLPMRDRERRLQTINVITAGGALGTPLISGGVLQLFGRSDAFWAMAGLVAALMGAFLLTPIPPGSVVCPTAHSREIPPQVGLMWGVVALVMFGVGLLQTALPLAVAVPLQWNPLAIGFFFFVLGVVFVVPQVFIRQGERRSALWVLGIGAALMTVLAFVSSGWVRAAVAVGITLSFVPAFSWALRAASTGPRAGAGFGWFESGIATGLLAGTTIGGVLWSWGGGLAMFGIGALILAGGIGILVGWPGRTTYTQKETQIP